MSLQPHRQLSEAALWPGSALSQKVASLVFPHAAKYCKKVNEFNSDDSVEIKVKFVLQQLFGKFSKYDT